MIEGIKFFWFDMDHTLINNDCDMSWKRFLIDRGLAPADAAEKADAFYRDYERGALDHRAFTKFQHAEFVGRTPEEIKPLLLEHFANYVLPKVYPDAKSYIEDIQENGGKVGILTSTCTAIAGPLAEYFKADILLGTELEKKDGRYTGDYVPPYAGGPGKVELLGEFSRAVKIPPAELAYYGDSVNDRFVLDYVGHPFAVNPDEQLKRIAGEKHWNIIAFN